LVPDPEGNGEKGDRNDEIDSNACFALPSFAKDMCDGFPFWKRERC
jgi:hypothetical protein